MAVGNSFDDQYFEMYADKASGRLMPQLPLEYAESAFAFVRPLLFANATEDANEVVGELTRQQDEIYTKMESWSTARAYGMSVHDKKWDVSSQMPATDALHVDLTLPEQAELIGRMLVGHYRMFSTSEGEAVQALKSIGFLRRNGTEGIEITHVLARAFLALGSRFGIVMVDQIADEVIPKHDQASERESLRLIPTGGSLAFALFEDSQIKGATPPTIDELAQYFRALEQLQQFEVTTVIIDTLGSLSQVSPALKKFAAGFYKQHKGMLFAEKPRRTFDALDKLIGTLSGDIKGTESTAIDKEMIALALQGMIDRMGLYRGLVEHFFVAGSNILNGKYEGL